MAPRVLLYKFHPLSPPFPHLAPSARAGRGPPDPGQPMVDKVLTGNGITAYGNGAYGLIGGDELSDAERDALQQLCRQHLDAFRAQRGEEVACWFVEKPAASATVRETAPRSAAQ